MSILSKYFFTVWSIAAIFQLKAQKDEAILPSIFLFSLCCTIPSGGRKQAFVRRSHLSTGGRDLFAQGWSWHYEQTIKRSYLTVMAATNQLMLPFLSVHNCCYNATTNLSPNGKVIVLKIAEIILVSYNACDLWFARLLNDCQQYNNADFSNDCFLDCVILTQIKLLMKNNTVPGVAR